MATIKQIAERAGVSIGTVDRVLHNRGRVDPAKESRIREIIEELSYTPNLYARQLKLSKRFMFGVLIPRPDQDGFYWERPKQGIDEAISELNAQKINVKYFHFDENKFDTFENQSEKILSEDMDGLIVAPQFVDCCETLVKQVEKKMPVVLIDSPLTDMNPLCFIGQDAFQSGVVSGKLMKGLIHGSGSVVVIRPRPLDIHITQRAEGFVSFFEKSERITVKVADVNGCDNREEFRNITHGIIQTTENLKGVFVTNARTYSVAESVVQLCMQNQVQIIGYDLVPENLKYLEDNVIDYLISQTPRQQGYRAVYALYRHLVLQEEVPEKIMMPIDIITKENVAFYNG